MNEWMNVVLDELIVCHILSTEHLNNPKKALNDAIHWNSIIAADPRVSDYTHEMIEELLSVYTSFPGFNCDVTAAFAWNKKAEDLVAKYKRMISNEPITMDTP